MSKTMPDSCIIAPVPESAELLEYCTRWSRLDGNVLLSPEFRGVSSGAKVIYGYLGLFINHEDRSWQVSVGLLARYSEYTEKHVRRCLAELEAAELLARRTVFWINQLGARQSANIYTLTNPPSMRVAPAGQLVMWPDQEAPERVAEDAEPARNAPDREASSAESDENAGLEEEFEEVGTSEPAELGQVEDLDSLGARMSAPLDENVRGGDPKCPPFNRPMNLPYETKLTFPSKSPSPSQAPPPNPRPAGGGADRDQVWFILDRYAERSDDWWKLAAEGSCGIVGEVLGDLRTARKLGGHTSCRKRTIRPSLVTALGELAEVRAQRQAEAEALAEEERREAKRQAAELARWQAEQERQRAEQERQRAAELARMNQEAAELAAELDDLIESLDQEESPLPDNPNPKITDARGLPPELRSALFRFCTRHRTIGEARELSAELRSGSFQMGVLRIARELLAQHAAPARKAA